jgi:hypothetical protein
MVRVTELLTFLVMLHVTRLASMAADGRFPGRPAALLTAGCAARMDTERRDVMMPSTTLA